MEIDTERIADTAEEVVRSRTFLIAVTLFVAAFAVRWMFHDHGFWIDEGRALMTSKNLLLGNGMRKSHEALMGQHPFMFYTIIAFFYLIFGIKAVAGMVAANMLAALTVALVFLIGKELFNEYAGVAGAVLMMVNPLHFFYSTRILTDVPVTFFVTLTLYFWVRYEQREEPWAFYAIFAAAGLTMLTKLSGIVVLPALFIYYLYKEREKLFFKRRYWYGAAVTVALYALWEVRNVVRRGTIGIVEVAAGAYFRTGGGGGGGGSKFVAGLVSHTMSLPKILGLPGLILALLGLAYAYIYEDRRMVIPAFFVGFAFLFLSPKVITRYVLPFVPMAMVVAGYGAERTRQLAATQGERAGQVAMAGILLVSAGLMFTSAAGMVNASASSFTGLDEAGKWIRANSAEDAKVIAGSGHTIRFFSDRWTKHAGKISDRDEFYRILTTENIQYVVVDRWERTQPKWYLRIVQQSDAFQPLRGFGPRKNPSVVVYQVKQDLIGG